MRRRCSTHLGQYPTRFHVHRSPPIQRNEIPLFDLHHVGIEASLDTFRLFCLATPIRICSNFDCTPVEVTLPHRAMGWRGVEYSPCEPRMPRSELHQSPDVATSVRRKCGRSAGRGHVGRRRQAQRRLRLSTGEVTGRRTTGTPAGGKPRVPTAGTTSTPPRTNLGGAQEPNEVQGETPCTSS